VEEDLLEVLQHLVMAALLAGALCVASIVAAGTIVFLVWLMIRGVRGIVVLAHRARSAAVQRKERPRTHPVPVFPRRLRRP
jgi:hypothetical protein